MDKDKILAALEPLASIADAFDKNELDDEARKYWGVNNERVNTIPPDEIEIYQGRGGKRLLTIQDCLLAREVYNDLLC